MGSVAATVPRRGTHAWPPNARSRWPLILLVAAVAYWTYDLAVLRAGAPHPLDDIWEDALIARELIDGRPWRTTMIYPPLWPMRDPVDFTVPVLVHGPLLALLLVAPLQVFGDRSVDHLAWAAAALAIATAALVFRIARRRFDERVAIAASLLFTLSPLTLESVHHSLSVMLGACLLTLALDLAWREEPRPLAAGMASGLGYLVRPEMLVVAPILAWISLGTPLAVREVRAAAGRGLAFALGFVVCAAAWWGHHAMAAGSPFFNLTSYTLVSFWGDRPGPAAMRDFALTLDRWPSVLAAELPRLADKWITFLPHAIQKAALTPTGATGWLVLVGAWSTLRAPHTRRVAFGLGLLALLPVASMTLTIYQRLYLVPFLSIYALAAGVGALRVMQRLPGWAHRRRALVGALLLATLPSVGPALRTGANEGPQGWHLLSAERAGLAEVTRARPSRGRNAQAGPADEQAADEPAVMFSDRPSFVAWVTRRPALWVLDEDFARLYPRHSTPVLARFHGLPAERDTRATWFHDGHWAFGYRAP